MNPQDIQKALQIATPEEKVELQALLDELSRRETRERCQQDFLSFVRHIWPSFIEGEHHRRIANLFNQIAEGSLKRLIISMPPRHAIEINELIPTTKGLKPMHSLQVGDYVFGSDGRPTPIIGVSEIFENRQLYNVITDDGFTLIVDGEHLWTISLDRRDRTKFLDYTTEQLWERQQGAVFKKGVRQKNTVADPATVRLPMLPTLKTTQYQEQNLLVDPYVLGVWLGDGHNAQAIISSPDFDAMHIRPEFERRGYVTTDQKTKCSFGVLDLKVKLRELGVLGNKHIPQQYLIGSEQQRRDLLKGLMDTDGNVSKAGQCYWAQSDKNLIDQVRTLLASLGIKNSVCETEAKIYDKSYGPTWRLHFYAKDVCTLKRKEERTLASKGTRFGRYIKIEKLPWQGNTRCIKIANADGLFLAGEGHIITHNTKSEFASYLLPAWYLGLHPDRKIIQVSNTAELAEGFGSRVRNLIDTEEYKAVFQDIALRADSKARGRWNTNKSGDYFAAGVGAALAGRGADLAILDDLHTEAEALAAVHNPGIYDKVYDWYTTGIRQRLQPGGAIVIVMTRWSQRDIIGQILENMAKPGTDKWNYVEFPALLPSDKPLWPEFWSYEELSAVRSEIPIHKWQAQYQQQPSSDETAIVKRDWWNRWTKDTPPECDYTIMSLDCAFEAKESADFSAMTYWGVFINQETHEQNIILLDAERKKLEFPELKQWAYDLYQHHEPDTIIVEKKASGAPLIFEFRRMGVPVQEYTPTRKANGISNDKIARLNAVADIFSSGMVWAPYKRWAEDVIEELANFPAGRYDDYCDTAAQALALIRKGNRVSTRLDKQESWEDRMLFKARKARYY